jgi:hypothetical protein
MNHEGMLKPALISGVILGIVSVFPVISALNCICCAWVIGAGVLAAHLYVKSSPQLVMLGSGAALGMLTGIIGAVVDMIFSIPLHLLMRGLGADIMEQVQQAMDRVPSIPPATRALLQSIFARGAGAGMFFIILGGIFNIIIFGLMGMLGGTLGVALCEKRKPGLPVYPATPCDPPKPPYEPPTPPDIPMES